jgi:transposase
LDARELEAILERAKTSPLSEEEYGKLHAVVETLLFLTRELDKKRVSIQKLKQLLFGSSTESTRKVVQKLLEETGAESPAGADENPSPDAKPPEEAKGHGRHAADAYVGAQKVHVPHESLKPGDACPTCQKGTVYESVAPARLVRIRGQAPLGATVYELQKLRCNLCGEIFTAQPPPGVGPDKYDAASASMIALLKYGTGLPFNRLQRLEGSLGIPLPAATQWEIVERSAERIKPVFEELIRQAAQGDLFHNDDSAMKILALCGLGVTSLATDGSSASDRKGVFTSAIVSILDDLRIALFFTGPRHAGENLAAVLKQRACELDRPIQMCDALSRNLPKALETIVANCLAHGRRGFVEVAAHFPDECLVDFRTFRLADTDI